jgi:hypothetical protein
LLYLETFILYSHENEKHMMTPTLVLVTMAAYFAVLFGISYLSGRKADNQGFFTGNRKSPWALPWGSV